MSDSLSLDFSELMNSDAMNLLEQWGSEWSTGAPPSSAEFNQVAPTAESQVALPSIAQDFFGLTGSDLASIISHRLP